MNTIDHCIDGVEYYKYLEYIQSTGIGHHEVKSNFVNEFETVAFEILLIYRKINCQISETASKK